MNTTSKLILGIVGVGAVGTASYFIANAVKNAKKNKESGKLLSDNNTQLATQIYNAFNPNFLRHGGTDEEALYTIAEKISDWEKISLAYKNLFNRNLTEDLQDELSSEELQKFLSIAKKSSSDSKKRQSGYIPTTFGKYKFVASATVNGIKINTNQSFTIRSAIHPVTDSIYNYPKSRQITIAGLYKINQIALFVRDAQRLREAVWRQQGVSGLNVGGARV